jgi:cell division protease FtsH
MEPRQRTFAIGLVAIVVVAMFVLQFPFFGSRAGNVSYSEFKALVKTGKVANLIVGKETISGTLSTDGTRPFVTARVDDPGLVAELEQANVKFTGRVENTWLSTLLSWVLPALVFVGIWLLVMRRFGPRQGLLAIGKNKARVYVEHNTGVTFGPLEIVLRSCRDIAEDELFRHAAAE